MQRSVKDWLSRWERAIQEQDFESGAELFHEQASGFGTVTERTTSRADLIERQWRMVWPRTRGFSFDPDSVVIQVSPDAAMALAHASWTSAGVDEKGAPRARSGRCTVVLTRTAADAPWRCVHTHFSMWPQCADALLLRSA
jgi:ketosteroid isomerase-like protein